MSSSQKTPYLSLNRWNATDAPLRVDFNSDNQIIDDLASRLETRLQALAYGVEDALFGVYALTLRAYYDNKTVNQRATLFFDGFSNYTQCDDTLTTAHLQDGMHHYDRYFAEGTSLLATQAFVKNTQFAHVMKPSGPFYLFETKVAIGNQFIYQSAPAAVQLCATTLDAQDKPTGSIASVLSSFEAKTEYNGSARQHTFPVSAQGVYVDAGQYGLTLAVPGMQQANEWINFSMFARTRIPDSYLCNNGTATTYPYTASPLNGKLIYINNPPIYYSKEITPIRPVTTATLFITCDNASLGNLRPSLALYNPGGTPHYVALTNAPSDNAPTTDGLVESIWRLPAQPEATRARLRLQVSGYNTDNVIRQFGCILGNA